jgi:phosphoribosylaminoimidazole-succinocarboxamide synthase
MSSVIRDSQLPGVNLFRRGKVRDVYDLGGELLIVATDRISAFDVVLPTPIPDKGKVLNLLSAFWFGRFQALIPNHMVSIDPAEYPLTRGKRGHPSEGCPLFPEWLQGRSMLVRKTTPLPIECVVRGYLAGTGWKDYQRAGAVCGISLPAGLQESDRLRDPIFTPATKAEAGHDENITPSQMADLIGSDLAQRISEVSLRIYSEARSYAEQQGIIIADTKFEFGLYEDALMLIDEVLTPDSSRFWLASTWRPGIAPPSLDKQPVRDYLAGIGWDKQPPAPELPSDVIAGTRRRYLDAYRRLTSRELLVEG